MNIQSLKTRKLSRSQFKALTGGSARSAFWCCANSITPWAEYEANGNSCFGVLNYCNQVGGTLGGSCNCSPACML